MVRQGVSGSICAHLAALMGAIGRELRIIGGMSHPSWVDSEQADARLHDIDSTWAKL